MESEALGLENVVGIFAILGLAMIFTVFSLFLECFAKYVPSIASYFDTSCIIYQISTFNCISGTSLPRRGN